MILLLYRGLRSIVNIWWRLSAHYIMPTNKDGPLSLLLQILVVSMELPVGAWSGQGQVMMTDGLHSTMLLKTAIWRQ
jgi:hypothetical protein